MNRLDDPAIYSLDASGMFEHIALLGAELVRAWDASAGMVVPAPPQPLNGVVVAGVGGSATGGDYFAALSVSAAPCPVVVVRGYALPAWVNRHTLVILTSYSGDTEETLACFQDAQSRGASTLAVTRGGGLAREARAVGAPVYVLTYESPPRVAIAHNLVPLLRVGVALGLCPVTNDDIAAAGRHHSKLVQLHIGPDQPSSQNRAKQIAAGLKGRFVIVMAAEHLLPVARRVRNQLAENGKALGSVEEVPEANHNLIVGLDSATDLSGAVSILMLGSERYGERVKRRFEATAQLFLEAGIEVQRLSVTGTSVLDELILGTAWGDYIASYLGLLNGKDPTPIPQIDRIKAALAAQE